MATIVKLQRPLSHADGPVLIYDEARTHMATVPNTPAMKAMFGERAKIFAVAKWTRGAWYIGPMTADQNW